MLRKHVLHISAPFVQKIIIFEYRNIYLFKIINNDQKNQSFSGKDAGDER